jgi:glutathione S-transferase
MVAIDGVNAHSRGCPAENAHMLKIYGRANSINVRKVLWMADEVGEPFEREDWGRGYRPVTDAFFKKLNPMQTVPVIDDGGFILRESHVIVRYLADKHERTDLYPAEAKARYQVDAWMDWAGSDLYWGVRPVFIGKVVKLPGALTEPSTVAAGIADWSARMRLLEEHLEASGPFLMGANFSVADIPVGMVVNRWFSIDFDKPVLPAVAAYYDRLADRPAYKRHGRNGTP